MSTPDRDEELETFLERRSVLPRDLAEQERAEPPVELDRIVLAKARAAIDPARKPVRSTRWMVPVALAATLVLSLGIVLRIQRPTAQDNMTAAAPVAAEPPPPRTVREYDAAESSQSGTGNAVAAVTDARESLAKSAAPPEESRRAAAASAQNAPLIASRNRVILPERQDTAADTAATTDTVVTGEMRAEAAAAPPPPPAPAAPGAPPESESKLPTDPRAWLQRIERLRAAGKNAQADREWLAFRKRYPDFVTDTVTDSVAK